MKIPKDNEVMTKKYTIDKGGICGQSCLAVIENTSIQEVMDNWENIGLEFKGWSGWRQLRKYLEERGYEVKQIRYDEDKFWNMDKFFIVRIQWIGERENKEKPFYGWGHWSEASAHTHFIVVNDFKVFCNETGIFDFDKLKDYLKENNAVITSLMAITPKV